MGGRHDRSVLPFCWGCECWSDRRVRAATNFYDHDLVDDIVDHFVIVDAVVVVYHTNWNP